MPAARKQRAWLEPSQVDLRWFFSHHPHSRLSLSFKIQGAIMVKVEQAAHQSKIIKRRGQASRIPQEREKKRKLFLVALQLQTCCCHNKLILRVMACGLDKDFPNPALKVWSVTCTSQKRRLDIRDVSSWKCLNIALHELNMGCWQWLPWTRDLSIRMKN